MRHLIKFTSIYGWRINAYRTNLTMGNAVYTYRLSSFQNDWQITFYISGRCVLCYLTVYIRSVNNEDCWRGWNCILITRPEGTGSYGTGHITRPGVTKFASSGTGHITRAGGTLPYVNYTTILTCSEPRGIGPRCRAAMLAVQSLSHPKNGLYGELPQYFKEQTF